MSEYQYYEFLALDRPLTAKQRRELRSISSRAEITATRFVNEYEWGDLKGNPQSMVERYFDAFLYLANWGTRHVMFRLPRGVLDPEIAELYCDTETASLIVTGSYLILNLFVDPDESDDDWDELDGQLAVMAQARSELAAGDRRLLYLAWLLALQSDEIGDEETEPPVPAGLGNLSAGLQAVVGFFAIDEDLIAAAASSPAGGSPSATPGRTAAELREAAADHERARVKAIRQRRREEKARQAAAQAAARVKRLDQLAPRTEAAWQKVADWIGFRQPGFYDQAVSLLLDLQALAERNGDTDAFSQRFGELRARHQRKPTLQERFDRAGLPG